MRTKKKKTLNRQEKEGLLKTRKYFREHLKRKKAVMDFFPEYQKYLADAGFSKI